MVIAVTTWAQYSCICGEKTVRTFSKRKTIEAALRDAKAHQVVSTMAERSHVDGIEHGVDFTLFPKAPKLVKKWPVGEKFVGENFLGQKVEMPTWR